MALSLRSVPSSLEARGGRLGARVIERERERESTRGGSLGFAPSSRNSPSSVTTEGFGVGAWCEREV